MNKQQIEALEQLLADAKAKLHTPADDGWIEHTGDVCPVHPETMVSVRNEVGSVWESNCRANRIWLWGTLSNGKRDIAHYKIIKEYVEPKPAKRLIDWSLKGMLGCMTNEGKLYTIYPVTKRARVGGGGADCEFLERLRLAKPKDNEGWQYYSHSNESEQMLRALNVQCKIEVRWWNETERQCEFSTLFTWPYLRRVSNYRIVGLQDGYTDNPEEAV
jgi:hypothetical protein